jgi:cyclopropane fatty-acyl-phospholipid synthase-like methyltransferase
MLEHVGKGDFPTLGKVIDRCLKPGGRGLIHTIGRNRPAPMNAWIERRIFPGAYPPSLKEMMEIFEPNKLSILDVENLRLHYSRTQARLRLSTWASCSCSRLFFQEAEITSCPGRAPTFIPTRSASLGPGRN